MKNLKTKLLLCLVIFAIVLTTFVTYANRQFLMANIDKQQEQTQKLIDEHILKDLQMVDTAHYYLDSELAADMKALLNGMVTRYEEEPDIANWDLEELKR